MLWEALALSAVALYLFYRWATAHNDFFEKRGIPHDKPFPLLGSMSDIVLHKKSFFDGIIDLYNKHDGRVYGIFDQRIPVLFVRDPDMIKQITIKDFDHFVNHRTIFGDDGANLFASSLFMMQDSKWKDMRSTLSPIFTGSKMRQMFQLMNDVAQNTVKYLKKEQEMNASQGLEVDLKDFCTRFTNDIIASTAFGIQVNSFEDRDNRFYTMGKKVTNFTRWQNLKFFMYANFKSIMDFFKIEIFDKDQTSYFMRLVLDAMKYRKENNIFRPDMINMLMEAKGLITPENGSTKAPNREWTDVEIVGQCFVFFFAGFETSATLMCFTAHELMENPDCQKKLYEEIEEVCSDGEPLTYEKLNGMKYLDMVISEVLRKWPAAVVIDRKCNKDFVYETPEGERIEIKKGEFVQLPVCGFHRDPKYFDEPTKFDPERFNDENKDTINPFTYFPFGLGPRNCIGSRFALLEAKSVIFYLVRNFRIEAAKNTTIPLELTASSFQMIPKSGFWLKFTPRPEIQT